MRASEVVVNAHTERLTFRAGLVIVLAGSIWELHRAPNPSLSTGLLVAVAVAAVCWLLFRAAFRLQLVIRAGGLEVVGFLCTARVPYPALQSIVRDRWGYRLDTTTGRIRVWGVPDSYRDGRDGYSAHLAVQHLGATVERIGNVPSAPTPGTAPTPGAAPAPGAAPESEPRHLYRGTSSWHAARPPGDATIERHGTFPDWWAFAVPLAVLVAVVLTRG